MFVYVCYNENVNDMINDTVASIEPALYACGASYSGFRTGGDGLLLLRNLECNWRTPNLVHLVLQAHIFSFIVVFVLFSSQVVALPQFLYVEASFSQIP